MTTTLNFKAGLDRTLWRPEGLALSAQAAGASFAWDMRNSAQRHPFAFFFRAAASLDIFNPNSGDWLALASPAMSALAAGATAIFHPSQGPRGTISAATSTTSFTLSSLTTAGGAAVGINQLANRGDGQGFWIKVVDNAAGATGKTEVVQITKNTSGATPVVTVSPALTFTPTVNSAYEILSGRVFLLGTGAIGANTWKYFDVACNSLTAKSQTNLAATIATDSYAIAFSELYVSNDRNPGDGFIDTNSTYNNGLNKCCVATASAAGSITCGALANPGTPSLFTNEYRNFQVRIVEDTGTPTSVGQRRNITSHTSGNTPVFTVPNWATTPSSTAKFVIEQNDDRIALRTSATTNMYSYSISGNAWDVSTTWTAGGSNNGAGTMIAPCWGLTRDATGDRLQGQFFVFSGGGNTTLDLWDITAGATGVWTASVVYGNSTTTFITGASGAHDPVCNGGRYYYINRGGSTVGIPSSGHRFDVLTQVLEPWIQYTYPQGGPTVGQRLHIGYCFDGATKIPLVYSLCCSLSQMFSAIVPF